MEGFRVGQCSAASCPTNAPASHCRPGNDHPEVDLWSAGVSGTGVQFWGYCKKGYLPRNPSVYCIRWPS